MLLNMTVLIGIHTIAVLIIIMVGFPEVFIPWRMLYHLQNRIIKMTMD